MEREVNFKDTIELQGGYSSFHVRQIPKFRHWNRHLNELDHERNQETGGRGGMGVE